MDFGRGGMSQGTFIEKRSTAKVHWMECLWNWTPWGNLWWKGATKEVKERVFGAFPSMMIGSKAVIWSGKKTVFGQRVMEMDLLVFAANMHLDNLLESTNTGILLERKQKRGNMRVASNTRSGGCTTKKVSCFTSTFTSTASFAGSTVRKWTGDAMAN